MSICLIDQPEEPRQVKEKFFLPYNTCIEMYFSESWFSWYTQAVFRSPFLDHQRVLWMNKLMLKVDRMFLKLLTISIHRECLSKSNYFVEFPEFLRKYSNFETFIQQHVSNTKYVTSIFKYGYNLIFFLYTFLEKSVLS